MAWPSFSLSAFSQHQYFSVRCSYCKLCSPTGACNDNCPREAEMFISVECECYGVHDDTLRSHFDTVPLVNNQ